MNLNPIPHIHDRLEEWGRWLSDGGSGGARSLARRGDRGPCAPYDPDRAMATDGLVARLPMSLRKPVLAYYGSDGGYRVVAARIHMAASTLQHRIYQAHHAMERLLTAA